MERFQGPWNHNLSNKILIIGNKGDPITPLANAKKVVELLGPSSAVLLERDGYGVSALVSNFTAFISARAQTVAHRSLLTFFFWPPALILC